MRKPVRPGQCCLALMLLGVASARLASAQSEAPIAPLAPEPPPRRQRQPCYGRARPSRCGFARSSRAMG